MKTIISSLLITTISLSAEVLSPLTINLEWSEKSNSLFSLFLPEDLSVVEELGHVWYFNSEETGMKDPQNFYLNGATIADSEGANEDKNYEVKPSQSKNDSSGYLCIDHLDFMPDKACAVLIDSLAVSLPKNIPFKQVGHWKNQTLFINRSYFYNETIDEFLKTHTLSYKDYGIYYEPFFKVYYYLEHQTDDSLKNIIKKGLPYERHIGIMIEELTKEGSLALDIGAHIGVHTITMSRKVGRRGAVLSFEPDKTSYMELIQNLAANKCNNVIPICKALGEGSKSLVLNHHMIQENSNEGDQVETISLDSLHLDNISLIKMDIENYEYFALKGSKETLFKNRPVIIFECWICRDYPNCNLKEKENFERVIALLESYGYEIHVIYCNDFIAFPKDRPEFEEYKKQFKKLDLNHFDIGL